MKMRMNQKPLHTSWYARVFAAAYDPVMRRFEQRVLWRRRQELFRELSGGQVLEVGAGTGVNFLLYPPQAEVLACEPSAPMLQKASQKLEQHAPRATIKLVHAGIGDKALEAHIPAQGLDAAVFTLVLCTIPDPEQALQRVKSWLKPSGRLFVLEHIGSPHPVGRALQHAIEPVWKPLAEGCHLTRDTDRLLRGQGFTPVWERYFYAGMRFYQAVLVLEE